MKLNINAPWWRFMDTLARFTALNALFLLTCLPVVTIGPSLAALYSTTIAYCEHDDIALSREYISRFLREFKQSIISWIIVAVLAAAIIFSFVFWGNFNSTISYIGLGILVLAGGVLVCSFEWLYPLQVRFSNTLPRVWQLSFMIPWARFGTTLCLITVDAIFIAVILTLPILRIFAIIFGFSWIAYAKSLLILPAFEKTGRGE